MKPSDDVHAWVQDYYGQVLKASEDLKTNACCATGAPPAWLQGPLAQVHPDVLCKGEDYATKLVVGRAEVEAYGGRVELVELLPGMSTTHVIARIESGRSPGNL